MPLEKPFVLDEIHPNWQTLAQGYCINPRYRENNFFRSLWGSFVNLAASFAITLQCVLTLDALLGCAVCCVSTTLYWFLNRSLAVGLNWNLVSLAIIFPVTQGIAMAFTRRELALTEFSQLLGNMRSVWEAMHTWLVRDETGKGWTTMTHNYGDGNTRARFDRQQVFHELLVAIIAYFDVPRGHRARNTVGWCGGDVEARHLHQCAKEQRLAVEAGLSRVRRLVQDLKVRGLPGGEVHRIDNYVNNMGVSMERLAGTKEYRTPRAMRAYARVYILIIGALFGPDYLSRVMDSDVETRNRGFALALLYACGLQVVLWGLFHVMLGLEDPFARIGGRGQFDSVRVIELTEVQRRILLRVEQDAAQPWGSLTGKQKWSNQGRATRVTAAGTRMGVSWREAGSPSIALRELPD